MANEIQTVVLSVDATADDVIGYVCPADGGAVTILGAYATNHATTSGTATFSIALHKRTSAGTVIAGTITTATGGTAASGATSHWTDLIPKSFVVDTTYTTLAAGESVSVAVADIAGGSSTRAKVSLSYVQGKNQ